MSKIISACMGQVWIVIALLTFATGVSSQDEGGDWFTSGSCSIQEMSDQEKQVALVRYKKWESERGFFPLDDTAVPFRGYSEEQLSVLARQGDLLSAHVLLEKIKRGDIKGRLNEVNALLRTSASFGSAAALIQLGHMSFVGRDKAEISKKDYLTALAYYDAAARMGAFQAVMPLSINLTRVRKDPDFHEADLKAIQDRSDAIIKDVNERRLEIGAEALDSKMPKIVAIRLNSMVSESNESERVKGLLRRYYPEVPCLSILASDQQ